MTISADQLIGTLQNVEATSFSSEADRVRAKDALFAALRRVQIPFDVAMSHVWTEPATTAAIKTLIDAGFWRKWVANGGQPKDVQTLARETGFDAILLNRLLRQLAGQLIVGEPAAGKFSLTPYTQALAEDNFPSLYTFMYEMNQPCFANFPKFMAQTAYKNPVDAKDTNFQSWRGKDQTLFTLLADKPAVGADFNNTMAVYSAFKTPWVDVYPSESIATAVKPGHALVVDVGGSAGHDLERFRVKHPDVPQGSLILQDLPNVVEGVKLQSPCVAQAYDFFTPQPVQGARAYFLHMILHDWPDDKAVEILKNLATALERGYSKILLCEIVIAPERANPHATLSDLTMMMSFSAVERSEDQWQDIVGRAGLRIAKIWTAPDSVDSVIEIELP